MLKSRDSYGTEHAFNLAQFMHYADILCYALDPAIQTQVKFVLANDKTRELNLDYEDRFCFMTKEGKGKFYNVADAESMLNTIEFSRKAHVKNYTDILTYRSSGDVKEYGQELLTMVGSHAQALLSDQIGAGPKEMSREEKLANSKVRFSAMLDRLEEVLREFIGHHWKRHNRKKVDLHYSYGPMTLIALNNKYIGHTAPCTVRLITTHLGKSGISITYRDRSFMMYSLNDGGASLDDVVRTNISALTSLCQGFDSENLYNGEDHFIKSIPINLGPGREHFMEYVSVRSLHDLRSDGKYVVSMITMNSDASLGMSKTMFHYHPQFITELCAALNFLLEK